MSTKLLQYDWNIKYIEPIFRLTLKMHVSVPSSSSLEVRV